MFTATRKQRAKEDQGGICTSQAPPLLARHPPPEVSHLPVVCHPQSPKYEHSYEASRGTSRHKL